MQLDEGVESRDHLPDDECIHLVRASVWVDGLRICDKRLTLTVGFAP